MNDWSVIIMYVLASSVKKSKLSQIYYVLNMAVYKVKTSQRLIMKNR